MGWEVLIWIRNNKRKDSFFYLSRKIRQKSNNKYEIDNEQAKFFLKGDND
jgi:hypothetical protein